MDHDQRKQLVTAVRRRLAKARTPTRELAAVLLADASLEDLEAYTVAELAAAATSITDFVRHRDVGAHKVRLVQPDAIDNGAILASTTLIEIVTDNMPFIVDSIIGELEAFGVDIRLVIHPVIVVTRSADGDMKRFHGGLVRGTSSAGTRESLLQIHVDRVDDAHVDEMARRLDSLMTEVRRAVTDWRAMRARLERAIDDFRFGAAGFSDEDREEAIAFLTWLLDDNFTLLGMREYDFLGGRTQGRLKRRDTKALGILADPDIRVLRRGRQAYTTTPAIRAFLMRPEPLFITKANIRSRVHRRVYMDYIGVKLFGSSGKLAGELRIVGLFTSTAYNRSTRTIPYLRRKSERVLALAGFDPHGHSGKALVNVLESYPRDELFHTDDETLHDFALAILELHERPRVRVLVRPDRFDRYVSVIVFVPRERYNTDVRIAIGDYLAERFEGRVSAYDPSYPADMALARVHFIIGRPEGRTPSVDQAVLEAGVTDLTRTWTDHLRERLRERLPEAEARKRAGKYEAAFPAAYREVFAPRIAVDDIATFESLTPEGPLAAIFHDTNADAPDELGLKLLHLASPLSLSERVPILENMGFHVVAEQTFEIGAGEATIGYIHDMTLRRADGGEIDLDGARERLTDALMAIWERRAENDGFNALVLVAGLDWRSVALIRAFGRYLQQTGTPYSQRSMWETLLRYPDLPRLYVDLFAARFDPAGHDAKAAEALSGKFTAALEDVATLEQDLVARRLYALLDAVLRTNFYQTDSEGAPRAEIVFKFDPQRIDFLPEPRPFREIYVYAPRLEGVHLRFGEVARGGLRWSDRPQDFRTEILGLVKAQQVKNAVIVPVGAKGGFVAKWLRPGMSREDFLAEGEATYRLFIASLLDITDNLDGETVVPPKAVVRRDGDDPYLVVAADKGTATFSDIANEIAVARGFWLGDAFASGGSQGYDHKKMGITARGAWEAVKRHFREMDVDIQTAPFTTVGVGDMSGDVFGNGMMLSPVTRLVAAFDHRDIFIDPDPDPAAALKERKRLFDRPRSSWADYKADLISTGGGVFSRRDKSIPLSREMRDLLGLTGARATPAEVIKAILAANVDLLWFGGVGTFVKAPDERNDEVGDRSNDPVRITADRVRARVVGEGANLGFTQRARIAYGLAGGRCNSDAIDNSAGVNTSDIEVNIKIALGAAVRDGRLRQAQRNRLLSAMTDAVGELALDNNYRQTLAISLSHARGLAAFGHQQRFMQALERADRLDREVELLPDDVEMAERHAAGMPLSRAELGVLMAYAKITLFEDLMATDIADDPALAEELMRYFPARMRTKYADTIAGHRLRGEIIVTSLSNALVNNCGSTFAMQVSDRTGADAGSIARAYVVAREVFALGDLTAKIDALDNRLAGKVQLRLYQALRQLAHGRTIWFLENTTVATGIAPLVDTFRPSVEGLSAILDKVLPERLTGRIAAVSEDLVGEGVPADLAGRIARLPALAEALDIALAARAADARLDNAARVYFAVGERFRIARMAEQAAALALTDYYDGLAMERAVEQLGQTHRRLTESVLANGSGVDAIETWIDAGGDGAGRVLETVQSVTESDDLTVSRLSVASGLLADFCRGRAS